MISFELALKKIIKNTYVQPAENVKIEDSPGRVLEEDVYSALEMPPFDKAAMDGYALKASESGNLAKKLRCIGLIQAGDIFDKRVKNNECVKVMTGSPLPAGVDSVVMVENTIESAGFVKILKPARKGENICFKGEDIKRNQKVIQRRTIISPIHVAVLAAVGKRVVKVTSRPKVAILNTGGEIVVPGERLGKNKIYNSNGPMLEALLKSDGICPYLLGIAKDNKEELKKKIRIGLQSDILLISGGVSMGDYDLVPEALRSLGVQKIFHKVNIKPGKPLFFGVKDKTIVFGVPGNPVSNFVTYLIFIRASLYKAMGYARFGIQPKEGILMTEFCSKAGRKHFVPIEIKKEKNQYCLKPVSSHGSADILSLSRADGFMIVGADQPALRKKSKVNFVTWKKI